MVAAAPADNIGMTSMQQELKETTELDSEEGAWAHGMLGADCEAATALGAVIDGSPPTPSAVVGRC